MARTGFTLKGNLEEVSKSNQVIDNLLAGEAQPFSRDDMTLFRNNFNFESYLDFIPDGNIFQLETNTSAGTITADATRVDVQRISNSCPAEVSSEVPHLGGTINLAVEVGDAFLNSPDTTVENLITFVSKPTDLPDNGFFTTSATLQGSEGIFSNIINNSPIFVKKKNKANYSPGTGRFTFGTDLEYHYSNGDLVSGIFIKGFESPLNISPRSDTPSIYPLKVSDYRKELNGQFSFILRMANNSPLLLKNSPSTANATRIFKANSPYLLRFDSPDILRFQRKLPVNANDFFGNVPPLFRESNGPDTFQQLHDLSETDYGIESDYIKINGFEDIGKMYNIGEGQIGTAIGNEAAGFSTDSVITYNSAINTFIGSYINAQELANKSVITKKDNFYNDTQYEIFVDGSIIIQDPKALNSPAGIPSFQSNDLAPATYIQETNLGSPSGTQRDLDDCPFLYRRAFSTFDGPWSSDSNTSPKGAEIFTHGNSPAHPEYVKALKVSALEFEDDIHIDKYNNNAIVTQQAKKNINASIYQSGFEYKMPIKVNETDPLTGELSEATYFLLLRFGNTTAFYSASTAGVAVGSGGTDMTVFPNNSNFIQNPANNQFTYTFNPGANVKYSQANAITITGGKLINITHPAIGSDSGVTSFTLSGVDSQFLENGGVYIPVGTSGGKTQWQLTSESDRKIRYSGGRWEINDDGDDYFRSSLTTSDYPWDSSTFPWTEVDGTGTPVFSNLVGGPLTSTFNTTTQTLSFDSDTASIANTDTTFTFTLPLGMRDTLSITFNLEST
jgi:hypothetical protein